MFIKGLLRVLKVLKGLLIRVFLWVVRVCYEFIKGVLKVC